MAHQSTVRLTASCSRRPALKGVVAVQNKRWRSKETVDDVGSGIAPPLHGLTVLDLTSALAGPSCTMYLADLGANVVKIEVPKKGDDSRSWGPPFITHKEGTKAWTDSVNRQSTYFMAVNRNKKSLTLNLKSQKGIEVARRLAEKADIVIENQISGKLSKLGFGYDAVKRIKADIIYASITGYGQDGPYARAPGYDAVVGGEAGIVYATGEPDRAPVRPGIPVTDILTGFSCVKAILAAVINKMKTGKGCYIDCAMFDVQAAAMSNAASAWLNSGVEVVRVGTGHTKWVLCLEDEQLNLSLAPYQVFKTKDSYMMIGIGNDAQWSRLCDQMDHPEWKDVEEYRTNGSRVSNKVPLVKMIEADLMLKDSAEWTEKFWNKGFPFGNVNNMQQVFEHPQAKAREIVAEMAHPLIGSFKAVKPAVVYHGKRMEIYKAPPGLGEDNIDILSDLGYSNSDIDSMKKDGAI